MLPNYIIALIIIVLAAAAAVYTRKLMWTAGFVGALVAGFVFAGAGFWGLSMLGAFFVLGSAATAWKWETKAKQHLEERHKGRRNAGQVLANGGVPALIGLLAVAMPGHLPDWPLLIASSISAATADTLSSELGMVYGSSCYQILSFKKGTKGNNGVVSIEGTLLGLAGSLIIGIIYAAGFGSWNSVALILVAGTAGNLVDSLAGALFENKGRLGNNAVNWLCTATGCIVAWLLG